MSEGATGGAIRDASVADTQSIAEVHLSVRLVGYRDFLSQEALSSVSHADLVREWNEHVLDSGLATLVHEWHGRIVGVVCFGRARPPWPLGDTGTVEALYVRPEHWGQGVGSALLEQAENALAAERIRVGYLGVYGDNARTRRF
jgi:GNAT superfamily N-acetyltransferase